MARTRLTEEFVHHFRHLVERTGNHPSGVIRALDKHPDLAVSVERLHEIQKRVETHRKFSKHRLIVQAHPDFPKAFKDFQERWPRAYAEAKVWLDAKDLVRNAKDFVRHYRFLTEQTGNDPNAIQLAFDTNTGRQDRNLYSAIESLLEIQQSLDDTKRAGDIDSSVHSAEYPGFREALADFTERWVGAVQSLRVPICILDLDDDGIVRYTSYEPFSKPRESNSAEGRSRDGDWHFDPDRDSVGEVIGWVEGLCRSGSNMFGSLDDDQDGWAAEGLEWLQQTVGLDFDEIQTRWKDFPVIFVPRHVSDKSGPYGPRELFDYLVQIRLAYIIGADLAAISLCRATTEILMQYHYPSDQKITKDLPGLIRSVQRQPKFAFLRKLNLIEKVSQAHDILHGSRSLGGSTVDTLPHQNWAQGLARDWAKALDEMITNAPARNPTAKAP